MMLCRVAKKPDDRLGLVVFLLLGRASDGVLIGDSWYHFRKGRFRCGHKSAIERRGGFVVTPVREATPGDIAHFERAVGRRWGWRHNCLTTVTWWLMRNP